MSDLSGNQYEVVDKSTLKAALSVSIGTAVAIALGFVPIPSVWYLFLTYIIAGLVTVWHFTKTHSVSIQKGHAVKLAFISIFLAMFVAWTTLAAILLSRYGLDFTPLAEQQLAIWEEMGNQAAIDDLGPHLPRKETVGFVVMIYSAGLAIFAGLSLVLSLFSGLIGAEMFKKGPLAQ